MEEAALEVVGVLLKVGTFNMALVAITAVTPRVKPNEAIPVSRDMMAVWAF